MIFPPELCNSEKKFLKDSLDIGKESILDKKNLVTKIGEVFLSILGSGLNLDGNIFTVNPSEAIAYMHLWQTKTPMLYRCMSSKIPTLVFDEKEFSDLLNKKTCILSNNLSESLTRKGIEAFLSSKYLSETTEKAYNYMLENTLENFSEKWNNILDHVCNKPIIRG